MFFHWHSGEPHHFKFTLLLGSLRRGVRVGTSTVQVVWQRGHRIAVSSKAPSISGPEDSGHYRWDESEVVPLLGTVYR